MEDKKELTVENERINSIHLLMLIIASIGGVALIAESVMMKWEFWMVPLLAVGLLGLWIIHIAQLWTAKVRERCFVFYLMVADFFYGAHATSFFDIALVTSIMMVTFAQTDEIRLETYVFMEYLAILCMQFYLAVQANAFPRDFLGISRIMIHISGVIIVQRLSVYIVRKRFMYLRQITAYRNAIEQQDVEMEDFMANISHELRTPINVVNGISTLVMEEDSEDIRSIHKAGLRIASQIEDISDYIEIGSGSLRLEEGKYRISSLINDIATNMRKEKGVPELVIDLDPLVPSVMMGDARKLRKVIEHLLGNAVKFTRKGGIYLRIKAESREYGVNLDIQITDTGIGMPQDVVARSAYGLYQANKKRNRSNGGIGLGLAIVYGFVHMMDGFVGIDSTEGIGTTVRVSIPQKVEDPSPCLSVSPSVDRCVVCYIRPEKYKVPAMRDFYRSMADHIAKGLKIQLHNASNLKDLKGICARLKVTHLFMGQEEYEEDTAFFDGLSCENVCVAVSAGEGMRIGAGSRVLRMPKPLYGYPIASILNAGDNYSSVQLGDEDKKVIFEGVRALVVDDEAMNLVVAAGLFKGYHMDIDTAGSGKEALDKYIEKDYDIIFMDHMMPEMDGVAAMKKLREIGANTGRIPIIVALTANAVSGARQMFMNEGFDGFIAKPIETGEFERVMKKVLPAGVISYIGG